MYDKSRPTPETGPEWMSFALGTLIGVVVVVGALYVLIRLFVVNEGRIF